MGRKKKELEEINDIMEEIYNTKEDKGGIIETKVEEPKMEEEKVWEKSEIIQKIIVLVANLEEIDEYFDELPNKQSKIDEELSDLLHFIENNDLTPRQSSKIVKLIQSKRKERRILKNDYEIKRVYLDNKNKLLYDSQREFLLENIYKKAKELTNPYKYRQINEDKIEEILKGTEI